MKEVSSAVEILRTDYGITTMKDLNAAIKKLGILDIFPFCGMVEEDKQNKEVSQ